MENKRSISLGTFLLGLLFTGIIFLVYYFFPTIKTNLSRLSSSPQTAQTPVETPVPVPTRNPKYKLPTGPQSYTFSHSETVRGPRVTTITFSPLAATKGETQSVSAVFPSSEKVSSVVFSYDTDNQKNQRLELKPKSGNPSIWEASWTMPDSIDNIYNVRLIFIGESDTYDEVMKMY